METANIVGLSASCRAIELRAKADVVAAADLAVLRDADSAARILARMNHPRSAELRGAVDSALAVLESRPGGPIKSRVDSHYWDLGFLRVEEDFEVVAVVDGDVLCRERDEESELILIGWESVRVDFGGCRF